MTEVHPAQRAILRYFEFEHLRDSRLQEVSAGFHTLAWNLVGQGGLDGPELTVALRKLLEAKDAAVRAALPVREEDVVARAQYEQQARLNAGQPSSTNRLIIVSETYESAVRYAQERGLVLTQWAWVGRPGLLRGRSGPYVKLGRVHTELALAVERAVQMGTIYPSDRAQTSPTAKQLGIAGGDEGVDGE